MKGALEWYTTTPPTSKKSIQHRGTEVVMGVPKSFPESGYLLELVRIIF